MINHVFIVKYKSHFIPSTILLLLIGTTGCFFAKKYHAATHSGRAAKDDATVARPSVIQVE